MTVKKYRGTSNAPVFSKKKTYFKNCVTIIIALLDALAIGVIEAQLEITEGFYQGFKHYIYVTSITEVTCWGIFRVSMLLFTAILVFVNPLEYLKRFHKIRHFVLLANMLIALHTIVKILIVYDFSAYVSILFWESCLATFVFSICNTVVWFYLVAEYVDVPHDFDNYRNQNLNMLESQTLDYTMSIEDDVRGRLSQKNRESGEPKFVAVQIMRWANVSVWDTTTLLAGWILSVLVVGCEIVIPYLTSQIVIIILDQDSEYERADDTKMFGIYLLSALLVVVGKSTFILLRTICLSRARDRLEYKIQSRLFQRILQEDQAFFDRRSADSLMHRLTVDVANTAEIISMNWTTLISSVFKSIVVFIFLLVNASWQLSFVMLICVPVLFYITTRYTTNVQKLKTDVDGSSADSNEMASECFRKIKTLKQFATEKYEGLAFKKKLKRTDRVKRILSYLVGCFKGSFSLASVGFLISLLYYGGHLVDLNLIARTEFVTFLLMHTEMIEGIEQTGRCYTEILFNYLSVTRLLETMQKIKQGNFWGENKSENKSSKHHREQTGSQREPSLVRVNKNGDIEMSLLSNAITRETFLQPREIFGQIVFDNVKFAYGTVDKESTADNYVLKEVSFTAEPGEIVALVGKSGCGKSTCLRLLSRMYSATSGQILLDGKPVEDYEVSFYHQKVSHVSSEVELLNRSIKENIQYGILGASEIDLINASKETDSECYLEEFYGKWQNQVRHKVSANKEQKLYLARALVRKPSVVLLDEVAMRLDVETEELFERRLLRTRRESIDHNQKYRYVPTIIVIAQKLSTIQRSDKIIVLDQGKVVGQGTHDTLIKSNPFYVDLVRKQLSVLGISGGGPAKHNKVTKQGSTATNPEAIRRQKTIIM